MCLGMGVWYVYLSLMSGLMLPSIPPTPHSEQQNSDLNIRTCFVGQGSVSETTCQHSQVEIDLRRVDFFLSEARKNPWINYYFMDFFEQVRKNHELTNVTKDSDWSIAC